MAAVDPKTPNQKTLDPKTLERLARLIVDPEGPYMRTVRDLESLLAHAGWQDPPEFDGTGKVSWLADQLTERNNRSRDIELLLCRICDPLEYDEGPAAAQVFREAVNEILEAEGLVVIDTGGRPVVAELGSDGAASASAEPHDLGNRVRGLIGDRSAAELLLERAAEAGICQRAGAYTMAVIAIGSFVEGMLYTLLTERDDDCRRGRFVNGDGKVVAMKQPNLAALIDTAHAFGWIQLDAKTFMHTVRNFRNYIHPRMELADNPGFDNDSVGLCWAPLQAMLNDLEQRLLDQG